MGLTPFYDLPSRNTLFTAFFEIAGMASQKEKLTIFFFVIYSSCKKLLFPFSPSDPLFP